MAESSAFQHAIESDVDVLLAVIDEAYARTAIPVSDDEARRMGRAFSAAIGVLAADCGLPLRVLATACSLVVSAALASYSDEAQIEWHIQNEQKTIRSLREYRRRHCPAPGAAIH